MGMELDGDHASNGCSGKKAVVRGRGDGRSEEDDAADQCNGSV